MMTRLKKFDEELQVVWGEVYVPNVPDSQGDFMSAEEIRKMAWEFLRSGLTSQVDLNHDNNLYGCAVVESFIACETDQTFIPFSWVVAVHVADPAIWELVKKGEINGFSMEANATATDAVIVMEVPPELAGLTDEVDGHTHKFTVKFASDGTFLGGVTSVAEDGHAHIITRGTVTEKAAGHTHRFSFVEGLVDANG